MCNHMPAKLPHSRASDPVKEFMDTIAVNLIGSYALSQSALPHMPAGNASIIHMSSTRAHQSEPDTAGYSASKAGLCGLTHSQVDFLSYLIGICSGIYINHFLLRRSDLHGYSSVV